MNNKMYLVIRYDTTREMFFQVCFVDSPSKALQNQTEEVIKIYPDKGAIVDKDSGITYITSINKETKSIGDSITCFAMYITVEIDLVKLFGIEGQHEADN